MKINSKEDIIKYFNNGCKKKVFIGVENEKFIFDLESLDGKRSMKNLILSV